MNSKKIKSYEIGEKKIGSGRSGSLYLKKKNGCKVVVKRIRTKTNQKQNNNEVKILETLLKSKNPNILKLIDYKEGFFYTEYCELGNLGQYIYNNKDPINEQQALEFLKQILQGAVLLAEKGIIHRDIKPENIFIKDDMTLVIGDFGEAIMLHEKAENAGTPIYQAPECSKKGNFSEKSDVWAIGVTFYEILTKSIPWEATADKDIVKEIKNGEKIINRLIEERKFSKNIANLLRMMICYSVENRANCEKCLDFLLNSKKFSNNEKEEEEEKELKYFDQIISSSSRLDTNSTLVIEDVEKDRVIIFNKKCANLFGLIFKKAYWFLTIKEENLKNIEYPNELLIILKTFQNLFSMQEKTRREELFVGKNNIDKKKLMENKANFEIFLKEYKKRINLHKSIQQYEKENILSPQLIDHYNDILRISQNNINEIIKYYIRRNIEFEFDALNLLLLLKKIYPYETFIEKISVESSPDCFEKDLFKKFPSVIPQGLFE